MKNKNNITVTIIDKHSGVKSKPVSIYKFIYNDVGDFEFENEETLNYNDFLFFQDDYDVKINK